jgi:hypothetical protein
VEALSAGPDFEEQPREKGGVDIAGLKKKKRGLKEAGWMAVTHPGPTFRPSRVGGVVSTNKSVQLPLCQVNNDEHNVQAKGH